MEFLVKNAMETQKQMRTDDLLVGQANIKVLGCGGAGSNMVNWLYKKGIQGAEIAALNTDKQHLDMMEVPKRILIGRSLTKGLGCGGFPERGREAAKENIHEVREFLQGTDMYS